ncbi:signal peptidase I [Microbacterium hydrothermale]|uniref:LamG-like jellyroll fold domain-containing protein n=1 Tax=Microbacterium hydrothermale TaxID=857427 RepID=UPI002225FD53|nr:LamG-like jellyroll fold domain-containing protein [Microbacterium hydrothermale]MCW2163390.1 signal peptidase I [Microbacterium hydrothermale]
MSGLPDAPRPRARRRAVLTAAVAIAVLAIATAVVGVAGGLRAFVVETPSMAEAAPVGSLVVVRPSMDYAVGDVITFEVDGRTVTHRLVAEHDGVLRTRGDLNGADDAWALSTDQVVGSAIAILPGIGFLALAAPWLLLGAALVEIVARLRRGRASWSWAVRLTGWAVTLTAVTLWLRPWFNLRLLDFRAADTGAGALMNVVNTGILPVLAGSTRLTSGQHAVVLTTDQLPSGLFSLTAVPDPDLVTRVVLCLLCLTPFLASLAIRPDDDPPADGRRERPDRRARTVLLPLALLTILAVIALTTLSTSGAAFSASVTNTADTAGVAPRTCRDAVSRVATPVPADVYAAYAMGGTTGTGETDISGNGRTGTWSLPPVTRTSIGCRHDVPARSTRFTGSQCLFVPGPVNDPESFSLEVWFSTTTRPSGKIAGFGNGNGIALDPDYWDRHIYLDTAGRVVFGTFPNYFMSIVTPPGRSYADGAWHAVVATLSPQGTALYVDGVLVGSDPSTSAQNYVGYWRFGCGRLTYWPNAGLSVLPPPTNFVGNLQYGAVYTRALTSAEVQSHYQAGAW